MTGYAIVCTDDTGKRFVHGNRAYSVHEEANNDLRALKLAGQTCEIIELGESWCDGDSSDIAPEGIYRI